MSQVSDKALAILVTRGKDAPRFYNGRGHTGRNRRAFVRTAWCLAGAKLFQPGRVVSGLIEVERLVRWIQSRGCKAEIVEVCVLAPTITLKTGPDGPVIAQLIGSNTRPVVLEHDTVPGQPVAAPTRERGCYPGCTCGEGRST